MRMRLQDKIVVGFVWWIIAFQAISFLYLFSTLLFQHNFVLFMLLIPLFLVVVLILCVSYYRAIMEEPGSPNYLTNINYGEEVDELKLYARRETEEKKQRRRNKKRGQIDPYEIQALNKASYCFKCDVVKERRVHHCSVCRQCIIRMDHHCPWVGNCVGKYNHKFFILFLFYATTGLLIVAVSITVDYFTQAYYANSLETQWQQIWLLVNCVSSYMLALAIGFLFVTQMLTSYQNITTLQSFTQGIQERNPWKQPSTLDNLREVFGYSNWIIPTDPFPDAPKYQSSHLQLVQL